MPFCINTDSVYYFCTIRNFLLNKNVSGLPLSGYSKVIRAYNKIECDLGYGKELVRMFTGQIQDINISETPPIIKFNALNAYRKLLKPIDPIHTRELVYEGEKAFSIVKDLCYRAGIDTIVYDNETVIKTEAEKEPETETKDEAQAETETETKPETEDEPEHEAANDFAINGKIKFLLGTNYSDAIKSILEIMNHRITGGRYGEIQVLKNEEYSQKDFHNWEFDDYVNMSEGTYSIDSSVIRNRVIVMSENGWQAFEDPILIGFCNGEIISCGIEVPWAETEEQKWAVADQYFLSMRRKMRRISVAVPGNPAMDIGDLVKMRMLTATANSKYKIIAIQSNYTSSGYVDLVDLEYVDAITGHLCEPAEGDYAVPEDDTESAAQVVMTLRDQIIDEAKKYLGVYYQWGCDTFLIEKIRH